MTTPDPIPPRPDTGGGRRSGYEPFGQIRLDAAREIIPQHNLTPKAWGVLVMLVLSASWRTWTVEGFTLSDLAQMMNYGSRSGARTVGTAIAELERAGLIEYHPATGNGDGWIRVRCYDQLVRTSTIPEWVTGAAEVDVDRTTADNTVVEERAASARDQRARRRAPFARSTSPNPGVDERTDTSCPEPVDELTTQEAQQEQGSEESTPVAIVSPLDQLASQLESHQRNQFWCPTQEPGRRVLARVLTSLDPTSRSLVAMDWPAGVLEPVAFALSRARRLAELPATTDHLRSNEDGLESARRLARNWAGTDTFATLDELAECLSGVLVGEERAAALDEARRYWAQRTVSVSPLAAH